MRNLVPSHKCTCGAQHCLLFRRPTTSTEHCRKTTQSYSHKQTPEGMILHEFYHHAILVLENVSVEIVIFVLLK